MFSIQVGQCAHGCKWHNIFARILANKNSRLDALQGDEPVPAVARLADANTDAHAARAYSIGAPIFTRVNHPLDLAIACTARGTFDNRWLKGFQIVLEEPAEPAMLIICRSIARTEAAATDKSACPRAAVTARDIYPCQPAAHCRVAAFGVA
eukprot:scaffold178549_cov30-Tisochrysis_lutea.AAC.2